MKAVSLAALMVAVLVLCGCPAPDYAPDLVVKPQTLNFVAGTDTLTFTVSNVWTRRELPRFTVTPADSWITVTPEQGASTGPSDPVTVKVEVNRLALPFGESASSITVSANGVKSVTVDVNVTRATGVDFTADTTTPFAGQDVAFTNVTTLGAGQGTVTAWNWNFGDGSASAAFHPHHVYAQPGQYTVTLQATTTTGALSLSKPAYIVAKASTTPQHTITIDGSFADWANVKSYTDPEGTEHDTDHKGANDVPVLVNHPDVDLLEYKFTHDSQNIYAYFRAKGIISNTKAANDNTAGRYYAIVTIDVDNSLRTGYYLHEGGYYPTSGGYDMNTEIEWYNGTFNTGHYLNHGCLTEEEKQAAFIDQMAGIVQVRPGTYKYYTQWVMFDDNSIVFVEDKGPIYQGIVVVAVSPDGHEAEMKAPFRGFMKDASGNPIMALGKVINISISLEASGELAPGHQWASDTGQPITGYFLTP